ASRNPVSRSLNTERYAGTVRMTVLAASTATSATATAARTQKRCFMAGVQASACAPVGAKIRLRPILRPDFRHPPDPGATTIQRARLRRVRQRVIVAFDTPGFRHYGHLHFCRARAEWKTVLAVRVLKCANEGRDAGNQPDNEQDRQDKQHRLPEAVG